MIEEAGMVLTAFCVGWFCCMLFQLAIGLTGTKR